MWHSTIDRSVAFSGTATTCHALSRWGPETRALLAPALGELYLGGATNAADKFPALGVRGNIYDCRSFSCEFNKVQDVTLVTIIPPVLIDLRTWH